MSRVSAEPGPSKLNFSSPENFKNIELNVCVSTEESKKETTEVYSEIYNTIRESTEATSDDHGRYLPGLVLSVIGDSESYVPKSWNTTEFESGLLQTVKGAKKSWIIYRGNKDGVSSLVDMAIKGSTLIDDNNQNQENEKNGGNQKVTLVAIKPFIKPEEDSENKRSSENQNYQDTENSSPEIQNYQRKHGRWTFQINPQFAEEYPEAKKEFKWFNNYLANLLSELSRQYTPLLINENKVVLNMRVPVVVIAVEGDVTTVHQIQSSIRRKIPVLLVKGSGKAVDFIIEYIKETSSSEKDRILAENAALLLGIYINSEEYENLKKMMNEIEKYRYLVTIYDLHSKTGGKMEDAIVKAILKGWSLQGVHEQTSPTTRSQPVTKCETKIPNDQDKHDKGTANSAKEMFELNSPLKNIYDTEKMTDVKPVSLIIVPNNTEIASRTMTSASFNVIETPEKIMNGPNVPPVSHAFVANETSIEKDQSTKNSSTLNAVDTTEEKANFTSEISHDKEQTTKNSTTLNVVEKTGAEKSETLKELYPLILTSGSLSLYFYIVYQYIKESGNLTKSERDTHLQVLLLHAIIADRDDYVSSLIQHGIRFDCSNMKTLYSETLQCKNCDGIDCTKIHAIHFGVSATRCRNIWCTCNNHSNQVCKMISDHEVTNNARQLYSILLTSSES
ncbi:uncharacterized protein [Mytilus edulis]|uniref:uncharacterized protein isoform X2 n=1 Tax=Mytilus edulis TaxID=6550 RepID=UPI0039EE293C